MPRYNHPDWHSQHLPMWREFLTPDWAKSERHILEIGSYEGRSSYWIATNLLTNPGSTLKCIDPFPEPTFYENIDEAELTLPSTDPDGFDRRGRLKTFKALSQTILPEFIIEARQQAIHAFDFIYIDGSHKAADVLTDAVLAWQVLKPGAFLCFDDYAWSHLDGTPEAPKMAIDAWLSIMDKQVQVLHKGVQCWVRRIQ